MWDQLGLDPVIQEAMLVDRHGSAILEHLLKLEDNHMQGFEEVGLKETISVTCWYLWWIRRRRTREEQVPSLYRCKISILAITANAAKATTQRPNTTAKWSKPDPRQVKLNVDASFHVDSNEGSAGVVLRDYQGSFIAASTVFIPHVASPAMAEARAMREGLSLANRLGCNNVLAESDSLEVIQACTGEDAWWNMSAAIFADCVDLSMTIGKVIFKHCPREANEVAHELARFSLFNKSSCNWVSKAPSFLVPKLVNDVTCD